MINIYGLKNCDSCRKAIKWLEKNSFEFNFFDFKDLHLTEILLSSWIKVHSLDRILNKRSTTWRNLDQKLKNNFDKDFIKIIIQNASLIKRPIWEKNSLPESNLAPGFSNIHKEFILENK